MSSIHNTQGCLLELLVLHGSAQPTAPPPCITVISGARKIAKPCEVTQRRLSDYSSSASSKKANRSCSPNKASAVATEQLCSRRLGFSGVSDLAGPRARISPPSSLSRTNKQAAHTQHPWGQQSSQQTSSFPPVTDDPITEFPRLCPVTSHQREQDHVR
uniref:Uncharacterized protein n=1 Tax=Knipowitschia caucasica TaxID=637954 RepID=A0AAV2JIR5_KNICA